MPDSQEPPVLLDDCVVLNLYAAQIMGEILSSQPSPVCTTERVRRDEALVVGHGLEDQAEDGFEAVNLEPVIASGGLTLFEIRGDLELGSFLQLATDLDDGEAECGAIALHRGLIVATDDRKALRVFAEHKRPVRCVRTSQMLYNWAADTAPTDAQLRGVLRAIRTRARFEPPVIDPRHEWWMSKSA